MTNLQQIGIPLDVDFLDRKETGIPAGLFRISTRYAVEQSEEEKKKGDPPMLAEGKPEEFEVRAPQFALDDTLIPYLFPPEGASGDFSEVLAHVTIANDLLPWERSVDNTHPQADHPWLAVMIFAPGELAPSTTGEVSQFSSTERAKLPNIAFPNLSDYDIKQHAPQQVRTIDVPRKLFTQIAPTLDELPYTAHVRSVHEHHDTELYDAFRGDGEKLKIGNYSIVISNRFAKRPGCYVAHLVSLEACASYFDAAKYPNATHLRLISLREWSFDNHPEHTNTGFTPTVRHLAKPGHTDPNRLRLALTPATPPDNAHLRQRLEQGYVPLEYRVPTGERTFAWYSGPFTASRRRPNPWTQRLRYGDNGLIYLDKHGVFDISYAAAWALGRNLVLANAELSAQLNRARGHAWNILHDLVGSKPFMHLEAGLGTGSDTAADEASAALHVADRTGERLFLKMLHAGTADALIQTWATPQPPAANDSCPGTPGVGTPPSDERTPHLATAVGDLLQEQAARDHLHAALRSVLQHPSPTTPDTPDALTNANDATSKEKDSAHGLDPWTLLCSAPFPYLVPDARMLPEESVRFFYVDQAWLDALVDGATSVGIATTLDDTITGELRTALRANPTAIPSGMLLRSHLLADYPKLLISARDTGGKDITVFRRDLGDNVLLCLFAGTPHTVTFKEPYEGIHFGIDEGDTIGLRRLSGKTGKSLEGKTLENFHNHLRKSPADGQEPDVISFLGDQGLVAALTKCLHEANEISASRNSLSPAELAIEFVNAPKEFTFSVKLGDEK